MPGFQPGTARSALGVLPPHFADRFGWKELTSTVADARHSRTPEERR
jgi:hypothetical protein